MGTVALHCTALRRFVLVAVTIVVTIFITVGTPFGLDRVLLPLEFREARQRRGVLEFLTETALQTDRNSRQTFLCGSLFLNSMGSHQFSK